MNIISNLRYTQLALCLLACTLQGCSFTPPPTGTSNQPAADGDHIDAGFYWNFQDQSQHFRQYYVDNYAYLVKTYGARAVPPVMDASKGITKLPDGEYHCTIEVTDNFQRLARMEGKRIAVP